MKLLILGGTVFLGRAIARAAVAAGHDVTCATRGTSGEPPSGVNFVRIDRSSADGLSNLEGTFDAAIDVARAPSQVRNALAALKGRVGHWSLVSSCSVYADESIPFQRSDALPLKEAAPVDVDEANMEFYGECKVACEEALLDSGIPAFIDRAGLIVGPEDIGNRFDYWVSRLARGGEILAPGSADEYVQWIDVRDLAAWHVLATETGLTGAYDGIGVPTARGEFFAGIASGLGVTPQLAWADQEFLAVQEVKPWAGEHSLPMWLPLPEYAGFMTHDTSPAFEAGLTQRPLADTARDTLAWLADAPSSRALRAGLTPDEEAKVLAAWHSR